MNQDYSFYDPRPTYSRTDTVYAWLCFVFGFLFCQAAPVTEHPLGGFLLILALYITGFVILSLKKVKLTAACILSTISSLILSAVLILSESGFLLRLSYTYCLASYCYFLYTAFGNTVEKGFSDYIYLDYFKALCVFPFQSFRAVFSAVSTDSTKKGSQVLIKVLIGCAMAVIPTAFVFGFLSYDDGFLSILDRIFSFDSDAVFRLIRNLLFTVPLGMYGFGLYNSAHKGVAKDSLTADACKKSMQAVKVLPQITATVAVLPILFLYVVFFISQWKYYISGFTGVLPENFSYAEYARQGFFQLCAVSVINLLLIIFISIFINRGSQNKGIVLKILTVVFCLFTLILISTAVAKLIMYIQYYGLTQKRIYAMWAMVLIAIVFSVIALGQFVSKFRIIALSVTITVVMFGALGLCNVNAITANYNANRYLSGTLQTIDTKEMERLGDSAVPALVEIAQNMDAEQNPDLKLSVDMILHDAAVKLEQKKGCLFQWNLPASLARRALKTYIPEIPPVGTYIMFEPSSDGNSTTDSNCILTVNPDHTGELFYNNKLYQFRIENNLLLIEGVDCSFAYYPSSLTLSMYWTENKKTDYLNFKKQ